MTTWFRIGFEHALTHAVPSDLMAPLLFDMAVRQHPVENFERKYGRENAAALGGNPRTITEWAFDLGGGVFVNEPMETVTVDELALSVSCDHFDGVLRAIEGLPLRQFSTGDHYYKTKFWLHATVMSPAQRDAVLAAMRERQAVAHDRAEAFASSLRSRSAL